MSCGCNNNSSECPEVPYPQISRESVPSLIDNLVYALYGTINKSVTNGRVVWDIPCDPTSSPAEVAGIPREEGEGLLCYIIRVFGFVGQVVTSTVAVGSAVALSSTVTANVTSISLPAGEWYVNGQVDYRAAATTSITILTQGISQTTAALGGQDTFSRSIMGAVVPTASNDFGIPIRGQRIALTATTPIYLVANATFTVAGLSAYGKIEARRIL